MGLRVLQFGRFWNDEHGGVERHVDLLCRGLAHAGVEVTNLVAAEGRTTTVSETGGYRLVRAGSWGMWWRTAASPALLHWAWKLHRERPFDVFHLHFPDPLTHLASVLLPAGVPRVVTWHSDIVRQQRLLALYRPWLVREVRRARAVVAATPAHFSSSTQIPADVPQEKRRVIPYGLDFAALDVEQVDLQQVAHLKRWAQGKPLLFALGRHVYYKGFEVLMEALPHTDAHLLLGGDGPLRAALEARARALGVSDRVRFVGRIPEAELAAYFHACDVFVLPSVAPSEAFGLVQLEAMACGKPVVCTQLNNGVNFVNPDGVTGLTVPVGDPVALAQAIDRLGHDPDLRERLGRQAQAHALGGFSWGQMTQRHLQLYTELLATAR